MKEIVCIFLYLSFVSMYGCSPQTKEDAHHLENDIRKDVANTVDVVKDKINDLENSFNKE